MVKMRYHLKEEAELLAKLDAALTENVSLKEEGADLNQQLAWFKKQVYGQRGEKTGRCIYGKTEYDEGSQLRKVCTTCSKALYNGRMDTLYG